MFSGTKALVLKLTEPSPVFQAIGAIAGAEIDEGVAGKFRFAEGARDLLTRSWPTRMLSSWLKARVRNRSVDGNDTNTVDRGSG